MDEAPDAIRADIEETRARMGERAEALAYKADVPARSKDKVQDVTDSIKEKVSSVTDKVTGKAHSAGRFDDTGHGLSDTASSLGGSVSDAAGDAAGSVSDGAHRAKGIAEDNPLGLAIGAIAAGFLAGLLIPSTKVEQDTLGPVADKARERVSDVAGQVTEKAKDAAQAAEGAVKEQVSSVS